MSTAHHEALVQAKILQAQRELARRDLLHYTKYMFQYAYQREFKENWHHGLICEVLTAVHNGELTRVIIDEPPSYTKTELCVRQFAPWSLGKNPQKKFIYGTYGDTLSSLVSNETRNNVESQAYKNLFPETIIDRNQNQKDHWTTTNNGRFYATSTSAAITGIHCDTFILDDPLKAIDAHSPSARKMVYDFYSGSVVTRLRDKQKGAIVLIAQRIHPEDLTGFLLEQNPDAWYHVKLQALNAQKQYYTFGKFSYERAANEPLWIEYENLEDLDRMKKEMGYNFDVQYQQDPTISEFGFFQKDAWSWISDFDIPEQNLYIMIDPAMSENAGSDRRAITTIGLSLKNSEELIVVMDTDAGVWSLQDFLEHIIAMMKMYPTVPVFLESQGGGSIVIQQLRKEVNKYNVDAKQKGNIVVKNPITLYSAPTNKNAKNQRIAGLKTYYDSGSLKFRRTGRGMDDARKEFFKWRPDITWNEDNILDTIASVQLLDGKHTVPKNNQDAEKRLASRQRRRPSWRI